MFNHVVPYCNLLVSEISGNQMGHYLHYMARFIAGFAVGFSSVWQLTLVTLAVVPLMAAAGGTYAAIMIGLTAKSQKAYAEAGKIAEEVHFVNCGLHCIVFSRS